MSLLPTGPLRADSRPGLPYPTVDVCEVIKQGSQSGNALEMKLEPEIFAPVGIGADLGRTVVADVELVLGRHPAANRTATYRLAIDMRDR